MVSYRLVDNSFSLERNKFYGFIWKAKAYQKVYDNRHEKKILERLIKIFPKYFIFFSFFHHLLMIFHKRIFLGATKIYRFLKEKFAKFIINYEKNWLHNKMKNKFNIR
jgi:hypothetical protein